MRLTEAQIDLYSRQIILREVGGSGQLALRAAHVLAIGRGAAHEACLSYLTGAGVGCIDVPSTPQRRAALSLPQPRERTGDVRIRSLGGAVRLDQRSYAVVVHLPEDEPDGQRSFALAGRPRVGTVVSAVLPDGGRSIALLPRDSGCAGCVDLPRAAAAAPPVPAPDEVAAAAAGVLAALACCRWLLGIGEDAGARVLRVVPGSALWIEDIARRRSPCPHGCPPPAHPV